MLGHFRSVFRALVWKIVQQWKMSFFSSLVANVTSGVANLSSRRFSLSRQDSSEGNSQDINSKTTSTPSITVSSSSNLSTQHGEWFFNRTFFLLFLSQLQDKTWIIISPPVNDQPPWAILINQFWQSAFWRRVNCLLFAFCFSFTPLEEGINDTSSSYQFSQSFVYTSHKMS